MADGEGHGELCACMHIHSTGPWKSAIMAVLFWVQQNTVVAKELWSTDCWTVSVVLTVFYSHVNNK